MFIRATMTDASEAAEEDVAKTSVVDMRLRPVLEGITISVPGSMLFDVLEDSLMTLPFMWMP